MVKRTLDLKLFRDIWRGRAQFVAMILLCALGTWCFSGLDAFWRMLDVSSQTYYQKQNMADLWVHTAPVDHEALTRMAAIPGVQDVQARTTLDFIVDLPHEPTLQVHATSGMPRINTPLLRSGRNLAAGEQRSCVLDDQFAQANGIALGDKLTLKWNGSKEDFTVVGTCTSAEHALTAKDVRPDPLQYGFMLCNASALEQFPLNEAVVTFTPEGDGEAVENAIQEQYPQALVVNRQGHGSTNNIAADIDMFRKVSYLFPLLAFAVAALIVLTTLTRMIENQRIHIGTLKSMGYGDGVVRRHYLAYALYPSLFGALLGLFSGRMMLPGILWRFETDTILLPYQIQAPISLEAWLVVVAAVALSILICLRTYNKNAHQWPAALLRPKPPKAGNKLLLERVPSLWRRLGFNGKMVMRNLFRNKLRTLMSFVGTACCTMLLITSLGLQDSVRFFVGTYYQGTIQYDVRANLNSDAGEADSYGKRIEAQKVEAVMEKGVTLHTGEGTRTTSLTVLEPEQQLLHLGKGETHFSVPAGGVTFSRKLADVTQTHVGDAVSISLPGDDQPVKTQVVALCDINLGQGIYLTRPTWEGWRKGAFTPTGLLIKGPTQAAIRQLEDMDEVDQLEYPLVQNEQMLTMLQSMLGMFSLLSAVALGLAFVVQYNMGMLNFMERYREYATLKVLGYHQKEIRRLITWESYLVMLMGVLGGTLPGRWFTALVLKTCEGDNIVFASTVLPQSYVISCAITIVFSIFVTWLLTRKVKTIDMVEALKSVE